MASSNPSNFSFPGSQNTPVLFTATPSGANELIDAIVDLKTKLRMAESKAQGHEDALKAKDDFIDYLLKENKKLYAENRDLYNSYISLRATTK